YPLAFCDRLSRFLLDLRVYRQRSISKTGMHLPKYRVCKFPDSEIAFPHFNIPRSLRRYGQGVSDRFQPDCVGFNRQHLVKRAKLAVNGYAGQPCSIKRGNHFAGVTAPACAPACTALAKPTTICATSNSAASFGLLASTIGKTVWKAICSSCCASEAVSVLMTVQRPGTAGCVAVATLPETTTCAFSRSSYAPWGRPTIA